MIGMFDSGVGGLTVAHELIKLMPDVGLFYLGDTARVPWGNKKPETISHYSRQLTRFLLAQNISHLIVACHTASSVAMDGIKQEAGNIPVTGMIDAAVADAAILTKSKKIAILGTRATINSGSWEKAIKSIDPQIEVYSLSCPLFVSLVEEGLESHAASKLIIQHYLKPLKDKGIDVVILACTHYPYLEPQILEFFQNKIQAINPGKSVARNLVQSNGLTPGQCILGFTDTPPLSNRFIGLINSKTNLTIKSIPLEAIENE